MNMGVLFYNNVNLKRHNFKVLYIYVYIHYMYVTLKLYLVCLGTCWITYPIFGSQYKAAYVTQPACSYNWNKSGMDFTYHFHFK